MSIDIACFTDLDDVEADAGGALDREHQPSQYDRISWFRLILEHCPFSGTPLVVRARSGGGDTAWLFLIRDGKKAIQFAMWFTSDFSVVTSKDAAAAPLVEAIAWHLARDRSLALITLEPLREETAGLIETAFAKAGWRTRRETNGANWSVSTEGLDWNGYWAGRSSRLRETVRRRSRKLTARILTAFDPDAWAAYDRVHAESWKPKHGSQFLRLLAMQESPVGNVRIGIAELDGRPVGFEFCLIEDGVITSHETVYSEDAKNHSPGVFISAELIRHAIENDKVHRVDFGWGNDSYKADWMDISKPLYELRLCNRNIAGRAEHALYEFWLIRRRWKEQAIALASRARAALGRGKR